MSLTGYVGQIVNGVIALGGIIWTCFCRLCFGTESLGFREVVQAAGQMHRLRKAFGFDSSFAVRTSFQSDDNTTITTSHVFETTSGIEHSASAVNVCTTCEHANGATTTTNRTMFKEEHIDYLKKKHTIMRAQKLVETTTGTLPSAKHSDSTRPTHNLKLIDTAATNLTRGFNDEQSDSQSLALLPTKSHTAVTPPVTHCKRTVDDSGARTTRKRKSVQDRSPHTRIARKRQRRCTFRHSPRQFGKKCTGKTVSKTTTV